jgi:ribosomal protein L29
MAILKAKEITKMSPKDITDKIKDLKMELIRANVAANRTNSKTKEIKRAISRLKTISKTSKEAKLKQK